MKPRNNLENQTPSGTYSSMLIIQLVCSGSWFFRTITGIQSRPDAFDKARFIMNFLTILQVTEIYTFRLALKGKTDKEIL